MYTSFVIKTVIVWTVTRIILCNKFEWNDYRKYIINKVSLLRHI